MKLICIRKSRTFPFYFGRINLFYEYESVEELKKEEEIYKMRKMSDKERERERGRWTFFLNVLFNAIFVLEKFQIRFSRNSHSVFFFFFSKNENTNILRYTNHSYIPALSDYKETLQFIGLEFQLMFRSNLLTRT